MITSTFFHFAAAAALACSVQAAEEKLPVVDLGYQLQQASGFNVSLLPLVYGSHQKTSPESHNTHFQIFTDIIQETGNFYNFSNIRYAAPPVGNLRFAAPAAPAVDRSAVDKGTTGRICPQASPAWSAASSRVLQSLMLGKQVDGSVEVVYPNSTADFPKQDPRTSEDCLFLDVFAPKAIFEGAGRNKIRGIERRKAGGAPVLVWIYGGGYTVGNKYENPAGLLAASGSVGKGEVVFVSLNYRLGGLGWSAGPTYQAAGGVSNLGLHDQRFALEWIQKNIHLFGGDPKQVTVLGESAGGGSIMHQITAYGGEGKKGKAPFQRAIPQSPGWLPMSSMTQQEDGFQTLLTLTNTTSLAELRKVPSDVLLRANWFQIANSDYGSFTYGPVVDGTFAPQQPGQLLAQGRFDKSVEIMSGQNTNEGPYFTPGDTNSTEAIVEQLKRVFPSMPDSSISHVTETLYPAVFNGQYPYKDHFTRANLLISEAIFTCNTYYLSTALKNETYNYQFAVPPAFHGLDIPYTFYDGGAVSAANPLGVSNRTIAVTMQELITSFTKKGVPVANAVKKFDQYGKANNVLVLNSTGIAQVRDRNANERCNWWQKALYT